MFIASKNDNFKRIVKKKKEKKADICIIRLMLSFYYYNKNSRIQHIVNLFIIICKFLYINV